MRIQLDDLAYPPTRSHADDAGLDLYSRQTLTIPAGGSAVFDTGVHIALPHGWYGKIESRSGLNIKHGIVSCGGVIDSNYRGSIVVKLYNLSKDNYVVEGGDRIAQLVIMPCLIQTIEIVDELEETDRGNAGFGSSGR